MDLSVARPLVRFVEVLIAKVFVARTTLLNSNVFARTVVISHAWYLSVATLMKCQAKVFSKDWRSSNHVGLANAKSVRSVVGRHLIALTPACALKVTMFVLIVTSRGQSAVAQAKQ